MLEVCVVVGTLQNDQKRAVLLEVFDDIMRMMVDVVAEDARLVLRLARLLFPVCHFKSSFILFRVSCLPFPLSKQYST